MTQDRIYSVPLSHVGDFTFDERVVEVFPDMIARSVPGYASVLAMTGELAERYVTPGSHVYDLGCSLGAATFVMRSRISQDCVIKAVDSSAAMVRRLRQLLSEQASSGCAVRVIQEDLCNVELHSASFAVLNFTLQFVPQPKRATVLRSIYDGLDAEGALVFSEKIHFDDPQVQTLMSGLHHAFKRANGYSELEIAQKRTALENTLTTETIDTHIRRLERIGFSHVTPWFQCFNFVSILAVK